MLKDTSNYGFVIMIDAIGIKASLQNNNAKDIIKKFKILSDLLQETKKEHVKFHKALYKHDISYNSYAFSDTFVIIIKLHDNKKSDSYIFDLFQHISQDLSLLFMEALNLEIFLRGAIGYGKVFSDECKPIFIGQAVNEVAEWFELSKIIGIHTTPSTTFILDKLKTTKNTKIKKGLLFTWFKNYKIPTKNGFDYNGWILDWLSYVSFNRDKWTLEMVEDYDLKEKNKEGYLEALENTKIWLLDKFSNSKLSLNMYDYLKFDNTIKFVDYVIDNTKNKESP